MNGWAGAGTTRHGAIRIGTGVAGDGIAQTRGFDAPKKETDGGPGVLRVCFFSSRLLATSAMNFTVAAAEALQIEI
jgi:hypothetical protein